MNRYVVSTECPSCGAPLDFNEGSNAVRCLHCRSNLLVTGHKQVLSYYIEPKADEHTATAIASDAWKTRGTTGAVVNAELYFIPYYRLTGHDFRWERAEQKPDADSADEWNSGGSAGGGSFLFQSAGVLLGAFFGAGNDSSKMAEPPVLISKNGAALHAVPGEAQINDRYLEKNFIACSLSGMGLYSLGVRPAVLKLKLFRKEALSGPGKIVMPDMEPEGALSRGLKTDTEGVIYRTVLEQIISVVYFPFWVVEMEYHGDTLLAILDAVSSSVVKADAPPSVYAVLKRDAGECRKTAGFRSLICPNCGWDLPIVPDDVIFFCSSCNKAWQIYGSYLNEVIYEIAEMPDKGRGGRTHYLPFWVLQSGGDNNSDFRFFLPAFRCRRLKFLADLAMNISRKQPRYTVSDSNKPDIHSGIFGGCCYDQEDAALLAHFVFEGLKAKQPDSVKSLRGERLSFKDAKLTWFPFAVNGPSLIEPFTGFGISRNLLL